MSRTAGFSLVASITQKLSNDFIRVYFANNVAPQGITLPALVTVAGVTVSLSGQVSLLPPEVAFVPNPQNAINVNVALAGSVAFSAPGFPSQSFEVILYAALVLPLATTNNGTLVYPGINFALASVTSVGIEVLRNPASIIVQPIQPIYQQALNSAPVLAALTAGLRAFNPAVLPIGPVNLAPTYTAKQPRGQPPGASEFDLPTWFTINLTPTRIAPVVLSGALTVGFDINGYTNGDPTQLVDLNTAFAPGVYVYTVEESGAPSWSATPGGSHNSDFAALINADVISTVLSQQVSPAIAGTLIDKNVEMRDVSLALGYFDAGIFGSGFGATLTADVRYDVLTHRLDDGFGYYGPDDGTPFIDASLTCHLQYYLSTRDGSTSFVANGPPDQWQGRVVDTNISLPAWLEPAALFGEIVLPAIVFPNLQIFSWFLAMATASDFATALTNGENLVEQSVGESLEAAGLQAQRSLPFPQTAAPQWLAIVNAVSLSQDGIDASLKFAPTAWPTLTVGGTPVDNGGFIEWPVEDTAPIQVVLQIAAGNYRADDPSLFAFWTVVRTDTGASILMFGQVQQLAASGGVASITIDHNSPLLAAAPGFQVSCRCTRQLGYRTDTIYSGQIEIGIEDLFDRHHPYVHWNHSAFFPEPLPPDTPPPKLRPYWVRARKSAIHRTEVSVRCLEMRRRGAYRHAASTSYQYLDVLPPGSLDAHPRKKGVLCDYCFFGGPTKTVLLP